MRLLLLLMGLTGLVSAAGALYCYDCHSDDGKDCKMVAESEAKKCQTKGNSPSKGRMLCSKLVIDGEITRGCLNDELGSKKVGCRESGGTSECYCSTNYCNDGTRAKTNFAFHALIPLSALCLKLLTETRSYRTV